MSSTSHMAKPNTPTCIRYVSETISGVGEITLISGNVFDVRQGRAVNEIAFLLLSRTALIYMLKNLR